MSGKELNIQSVDFDQLNSLAVTSMGQAGGKDVVEKLRIEWLGKEGTIRVLMKQLGKVPTEDRPKIAAKLNIIKEKLEQFVDQKNSFFAEEAEKEKLQNDYCDFSLPAYFPGLGRIHPVTEIERRITEVLKPFGFNCVLGPEIETEYYCFDSLNIPKHHPARDMQDTFFTDTGHLLRTHTTSVQARCLEQGGLPVKIASFGRVYRNETEDASHTSMFHQFELVWLDRDLTLSHLMGLISYILKALYGQDRKVRFVPKFYPYTEPSIGAQISCSLCAGAGCSFCGHAGWSTIGGAGMVHRNVLTEFKYNPKEVSGFAFGLGTSRLAVQEFGFPKGRMIYDNDLRVYRRLG